jgi:hypothetical protein
MLYESNAVNAKIEVLEAKYVLTIMNDCCSHLSFPGYATYIGEGSQMRIDSILEELASSEHELWPKATVEDVEKTEALIGVSLPESYRQFVTEFSNGAYLFMLQEVSAVGDGNKQIVPIQNIFHRIWTTGKVLTLEELETDIEFREGGTVKRKYLVPFSLDHNGNEWCFVVESLGVDNEYPVAYLNSSNPQLFGRLENFAAWLKVLIGADTEVIRTLYDDNVIYDELGLG